MPSWIREGKPEGQLGLEPGPEHQVHRPGSLARSSARAYGDPIAEDLRFVVRSMVGEENFIDMVPNRSNNYCCGGGGGYLQSGYKDARLAYGRHQGQADPGNRAPNIASPPATTAMPRSTSSASTSVPAIGVVHLWTLICLSLGILGPNEREYLRDDLKEVNVFHPESAM
jgi:hypothetical protein